MKRFSYVLALLGVLAALALVSYFGIGNESWGCGGNMRPEFYADNFRRYSVFVKNYPGNKIYRVACGPYEERRTQKKDSRDERLDPLVEIRGMA